MARATHQYFLNEGPNSGQTHTALPSSGVEMGWGVERAAHGWDWGHPTCVSGPPVCLRLTFSQRWAAACGGQSRDCEPGGPWGSSSTHLRRPGPTGISCAGACGRLRPVCTPHSAAGKGGGMRLGRWASLPTQKPPPPPGSEDLQGWLGARPRPRPLQRTFTGDRPRDDSTPGTQPWDPLCPTWKSPGPPAAFPPPARPPRAQTRRPPRDGLRGPLRSPPPPGAAGHTRACPASAGSRCRGGRGAATARRALRAGRGGGSSAPARRAPQQPLRRRARTGGAGRGA